MTPSELSGAVEQLKVSYGQTHVSIASLASADRKNAYNQLVRETTAKIFELGQQQYPGIESQMAVLSLENSGGLPKGRIFIGPSVHAGLAAAFIRKTALEIFGKPPQHRGEFEESWPILRTEAFVKVVHAVVTLPGDRIAGTLEYSSAHLAGGSPQILESRLAHYRLQIRAAQEIQALKKSYEEEKKALWDKTVFNEEEKMQQQTALADAFILSL